MAKTNPGMPHKDSVNNDTKALGPDGYYDDDGTPVPKQPTGVVPLVAPDPTSPVGVPVAGDNPITPEVAALIAAGAANAGKDGKSQAAPAEFQVNTGLTPSQQMQGAKNMNMQGPLATVHYGLDTALQAGFMGLTDQRLIDAVTKAANGKVEIVDDVYKTALAKAAALQKMGKNVTLMDILSNPAKYDINTSSTGPGSNYGPFTNTSRSVQLTDPSQARLLLNHTLSNFLGREASQQEQAQFLQALNQLERSNPTTTVTNGTTSADGQTSSSTTSGGVNAASYAEEFAKSQEGYAEYQASTTFLDAFIGALENKSRVI